MDKPKNKLEHMCFPQPIDPNIRVWKYMDVEKLISVIMKKRLFLCRLDLLSDLYEGSISKLAYMERKAMIEEYNWPDAEQKFVETSKKINKTIFVNCWRCDNHESEAMWKLYCPDNKGIALQTTYQKLVKSIDYDNYLLIGLVTYLDYENEGFRADNFFYPVMHKRKAFEHEKEVRIVSCLWDYIHGIQKEPPFGTTCYWDWSNVIENIYVNPYAENWYYETIKDLLLKLDVKLNVIWSSLKGKPYF